MFGLKAKIVHVKFVFIRGNIKEEIYMECPPGLTDAEKDDVLAFNKCIYGLVQAARQHHKKAVKVLFKTGFNGGEVDPCLILKQYEKDVVFVAIYVDENLHMGHPEAMEDTIEQLKKNGIIVKVEDDLIVYLSNEIHFNSERRKSWLGQHNVWKFWKISLGKMLNI